MLKEGEKPAFPNNDRILCQPDEPTIKLGSIFVPSTAQKRANKGTLVHAGLSAMDKLHDNGHRIGDRIWWGQYAGVVEEWDHLTTTGEDHEHDWKVTPTDIDRTRIWNCTKCPAERRAEPVIVMNVEDILANEHLEPRVRNGELVLVRGKNKDGQTTHVFMTPEEIEATKKKAEAEAQEAERQKAWGQWPYGYHMGTAQNQSLYTRQANLAANLANLQSQALSTAGLYDNPQLNGTKKDKE